MIVGAQYILPLSVLSCYTFNLYNKGGQDAHPTRVIYILDMQTRYGLAYSGSQPL